MEDSKDKEFINISNKKFKNTIYEDPECTGMSYKPKKAFWCSLKSSAPGFLSEYDHQYGGEYMADSEGNLNVTTVKLKPETYVVSPHECEDYLTAFSVFLDEKNDIGLSEREKKMFASRTY